MKTKIIYISGNEIFDMADIRAAFDQVRGVLNLGGDTVLFGVPVDSDDVFEQKNITNNDIDLDSTAIADVPVDIATEIAPDTEPETDIPTKKSRVRAQKNILATEPEIAPVVEIESAPVDDTDDIVTDSVPVDTDDVAPIVEQEPKEEDTPDDAPVVPILSILAGGPVDATDTQSDAMDLPSDTDDAVDSTPDYDVVQPEPDYDEPQFDPDFEDVPEIDIPDDAPVDDTANVVIETATITEQTPNGDITTVDVTTVSVDDLVINDAPAAEKTLEDLLESMSPLSEDNPDFIPETEVDDTDIIPTPVPEPDPDDATLEQLANEMVSQLSEATSEPDTQPIQKQGRLGKFKSVIGFSSKKRNTDSGLMSDLFGWAGVAANDDAFAMPDFFPTNTSK